MKNVEFRVRPVTRYNLTRYESGPDYGGVSTVAEFDNWLNAHTVAQALQDAEPGSLYHACQEPANELTAPAPAEMPGIAVAIDAEIERQRILRNAAAAD